MDNSFFNHTLLLCLALILILYLYQNMNKNMNHNMNHNMNMNTNTNMNQNTNTNMNMNQNTNMNMNMNQQINSIVANNPIYVNPSLNIQNKPCSMPVHPVGPAINFHQRFTKYAKNPTYTTVKGCGIPTGIRELGWRNMYLLNYSKSEVSYEDPFSGVVTRNFLNNMDSVDNIYRKCL